MSGNYTTQVRSTLHGKPGTKVQVDGMSIQNLQGNGNTWYQIYDAQVTVGGPITRDRLWFFTSQREWGSRNQDAGTFWNETQGTPFYSTIFDSKRWQY